MKHQWESRGDHAAFFITRRSGEVVTVLIDNDDVARVLALRWCARFDRDVEGYYAMHYKAIGSGRSTSIGLQRFILGDSVIGVKADHINHDTLDNRKANLRAVSNSVNTANKSGASRTSTSGYRGVTWERSHKSWKAHAGLNGKKLNLGRYKVKEDAAQAVVKFWKSQPFMEGVGVCHRL